MIFANIKRILIQLLRDKRTIALIFIVPLFVITLFWFMLKDNLEFTKTIGLINNDPDASKIIGELEKTMVEQNKYFSVEDLTGDLNDKDEIEQYMREKNMDAVIVFPEQFSSKYFKDNVIDLSLYSLGTTPDLEDSLLKLMEKALPFAFAKNLMGSFFNTGLNKKLEAQTFYVFGGKEYKMIDLFAPGFILFFIYFMAFLITCVSFLRERTFKTLDRIAATDLKAIHLVISYVLAFTILLLFQALIVDSFSRFILHIKIVGKFFPTLIIFILTIFSGVTLGIFLSSFARNEFQAAQFIPLIIVPQGLLCGLIVDIRSLHGFLYVLARAMPLTYIVEGGNNILLKGLGLNSILLQAFVIFLTGVLFTVLSVLMIFKTIRE